ncbi:MAG: hypothetical protein IKZ08_02940 [Bacteroidales bacterium]|nr:hypothetical protein [Bacteroidales bacterium]
MQKNKAMTVYELVKHLMTATNQEAPVLFFTPEGRSLQVKNIYIDSQAVVLEAETE